LLRVRYEYRTVPGDALEVPIKSPGAGYHARRGLFMLAAIEIRSAYGYQRQPRYRASGSTVGMSGDWAQMQQARRGIRNRAVLARCLLPPRERSRRDPTPRLGPTTSEPLLSWT
jgi:hypothetical protein